MLTIVNNDVFLLCSVALNWGGLRKIRWDWSGTNSTYVTNIFSTCDEMPMHYLKHVII